jgi:SAM-dependent methyltransferase
VVQFRRLTIAGLTRRARRLGRRIRPGTSDEDFIEATFLAVLGRPVDIAGRVHYLSALRNGASRQDIVDALKGSEEYRNRQAASAFRLPNLLESEPSRFRILVADDGKEIPTYLAADHASFDWVEARILENGYYERPGIWSFEVDLDKRVMAEIVSLLEPKSVVEVGCSSGAVLQCLNGIGIDVWGVDVSTSARERASSSVRERILLGDITEIEFAQTFDVGLGLDIFEHVHPNKLGSFITALVNLITPGGFLYANVPAFGRDAVFGEVQTMFLPEWRDDARAGGPFRHLQVDERGYPAHGHLVWATTDWWVATFEAAGLRRAPAIERALHGLYDWYFDACSPMRKSFYVFAKARDVASDDELAGRIRATEPRSLAELRAELEHRRTA